MSDAAWFVVVFVGFGIIRLAVATMFFYAVLPDGDRCPNCDAPTIRVRARGWNFFMPWFRTSYCYECRWHGLLRHGALTAGSTDGRSEPYVRRSQRPVDQPPRV